MKTKVKNVYYCDYCKKKNLCASAISLHEKYCTSNPNRECRMCGLKPDYIKIAEKFKNRYKIIEVDVMNDFTSQQVEWMGEPLTLDEIRESVDYCPACVLTVMKLAGLNDYIFYDTLWFNYKKETEEWWKEKNEEDNPYY